VVGGWGGAAGRLAGVEVGLEDQQQLAELLALAMVKAGEELVLGSALGVGGGGEVVAAGGAEGDDVAAVGRIASSAGAAGEGPGRTNVMAVPAAATLERLAGLLADGSLRVPIQASYPLAQVDQALKTLGGQHTQGKLAITLP
jgi:NADPH:quinone reductase-like Zn-dependent oxidoreductase